MLANDYGGEKTDSKLIDEFEAFLKSEKDDRKYRRRIEAMAASNERSIVVDYLDLVMWNNDLAISLIQEPHLTFPFLDKALCRVLSLTDPGFAEKNKKSVHVRIGELIDHTPLRDIPERVNTLITVQGLITRASAPIPSVVEAIWHCTEGHRVVIDGVGKPKHCSTEGCEADNFFFSKEESTFSKFQLLKIQESNEDLPSAKTPEAYDLRVDGDLLGCAKPGDTVKLTGVVTVEFLTGKQDTRLLQYQVQANYIEPLGRAPEDVIITDEERDAIKSFALQPNAYERLIASIAPAIEGEELAKESALLLAIGAYPVSFKDGTAVRGTINALICGDPGLAKSQLLGFMSKVAPRGIYSNGRASSAAGLTAAVVKEKNGVLYLEPGVVVLADQGVACIDEFLQMSREDAVALHEAMEQGTVSVSKAGFISRLNARTSILAAANPMMGKYDPYKSILENLEGFAIPLLTRFDLIVIARDEINSDKDARIAKRVLAQIRKGDYENAPPLAFELLKKYIVYAKSIKPEITDEVAELIERKYIEMRAQFFGENVVPITPRWLESLTRIAIARARALLHTRVTVEDASRAADILDRTLRTAAIDPKTKKVDPGMLFGKPASSRDLLEFALNSFRELSGTQKDPVQDRAFIDALVKSGKFGEEEAAKMFKTLYRSGQIYEIKPSYFKSIG